MNAGAMKMMLLSGGAFLLSIPLLAGLFIAANWAPERSVASLAPKWAPPPSTFLKVSGMRVHLRDEGPRDDATPIVLLHGTGSSLHAWEGWAQALKDRHRVIRFDLAGFGLTGPSPDNVYSIDRDVDLVIAVLDKLGVEKCILGGASLGGAIAWRTALVHPSRVEKLILVDAGGYAFKPVSMPIGFQLMRMPGIPWLLQNTLPRFLVVQGFRNAWGDPSRVTPEMVERSVELTQREGNRQAIIERSRQSKRGAFAQDIAKLKLRTLILWGGKDRMIPPENAHRFHADIAGSELVIFDDLGHAPEEEDPARSVEAVKAFFEGNLNAAATSSHDARSAVAIQGSK
jgi:pimeloyl-ACP methyl ester carboxylesterase